MRSATREALTAAKATLATVRESVDSSTGVQLLTVGRIIGDSKQLVSACADPAVDAAVKKSLVERLFTQKMGRAAETLLTVMVENRWSGAEDFLTGVEEIGLRTIAMSTPDAVALENELFEFGRIVASNAELELALGSKLGAAGAKRDLVEKLLERKFSQPATEIITHLVQQPRGRRIGESLRWAGRIVADQAGYTVATVTAAESLTTEQRQRLEKCLSRMYNRELKITEIIDPSIIGGLRVQLNDDVFDGSISSRITDLRLQLAG